MRSNIVCQTSKICFTRNVWPFGNMAKLCLTMQNLVGSIETSNAFSEQSCCLNIAMFCSVTKKSHRSQTNLKCLTNNVCLFGQGQSPIIVDREGRAWKKMWIFYVKDKFKLWCFNFLLFLAISCTRIRAFNF